MPERICGTAGGWVGGVLVELLRDALLTSGANVPSVVMVDDSCLPVSFQIRDQT